MTTDTMTGDNLPPVYDNVEDGSSSGNGGMHNSQYVVRTDGVNIFA